MLLSRRLLCALCCFEAATLQAVLVVEIPGGSLSLGEKRFREFLNCSGFKQTQGWETVACRALVEGRFGTPSCHVTNGTYRGLRKWEPASYANQSDVDMFFLYHDS